MQDNRDSGNQRIHLTPLDESIAQSEAEIINMINDEGNYTINECVENALYAGSDGCNSCQCNAFRSFSWCTRKICVLSEATRPPPKTPQPPTAPLHPPFPTQRPPPSFASFGAPSPPRTPDDTPFRPFLLWNHAVATPTGNPAPLLRLVSGWLGRAFSPHRLN
ncbi:Protein of unknown function [Gryllus bimaculatus]|nr:Protein of unknown function [Gryllus bimaculatus]